MKTTKSAEIKTRCTTELKEKLNEIAKQRNLSVSTITTSCLEAASITVIHHQMLPLFHLW